jgi:hypothetical protein
MRFIAPVGGTPVAARKIMSTKSSLPRISVAMLRSRTKISSRVV